MTITYRTTDLTKWGVGKNSPLSKAEGDGNVWDHEGRIVTLEARPLPSPGIRDFDIVGTSLYVNLTDNVTTLGPYTLPVPTYRSRGTWSPETGYSTLDTFVINGGFYEVLLPHESGTSFDAGASDGSGHPLYNLIFTIPGNSLPTGGASGQKLVRTTPDVDFAVGWSFNYPAGSTRQYLIQQSNTQDDVAFGRPQAEDVEFTPTTGSGLTSSRVSDAIEEVLTKSNTNLSNIRLDDLSNVAFNTGEPELGALIYFDGSDNWASMGAPVTGSMSYFNGFVWSLTVEPSESGDIMRWNGSSWAPEEPAVAADFLTGTSTKVLTVDQVWVASQVVTLTDSGTITPDFDTFINAVVTLGGNRTLANPASSPKIGQKGVIRVIQDSTGSRTLNFGSDYKTAGGVAINLTTTANHYDLLYYDVVDTNLIYLAAVLDVH